MCDGDVGGSLLAAKEMDNQLVALPSVYCRSRQASSFSTPGHDVDVVVGGGESPRVPARSRMSGPKRSPQVMPPLPTEACRLRNAPNTAERC
jgi:hypothetical protein